MMCFSAEASFTASIVLGAIGALSIKHSSSKKFYFLATIPFLFALQQLSEGFIWLHLKNQLGSEEFFFFMQKTFLIFAFLVWPVWIPFSLWILEPKNNRKIVLLLIVCAGIVLSLINFYYGIRNESIVYMIGHSLKYEGHAPPQGYLYPLLLLLPSFVSSLKNVWIFGILVAVTYFLADYFYTKTFVSVWCFFAAIVSMSVYKIIRYYTK